MFFIGSELDADCQSLWYTALLGFSQSASKRGDCIVMTPLPHDSDCNPVLRENAREADGLEARRSGRCLTATLTAP